MVKKEGKREGSERGRKGRREEAEIKKRSGYGREEEKNNVEERSGGVMSGDNSTDKKRNEGKKCRNVNLG